MEFEPRGVQGGAAIVREGTAHGRTVAQHDFGLRVTPSCEAPCDGAYPTNTLFQFFLGMAVCFIDGLGCLAEIMKVTELVWHIGEHLRDGTADGQLAIRNDANKRHRQVLTHGPQQYGEVGLGRGQQTTGEEDFPGEAIPEDPQHLMAAVGLEAIESQDDPTLGLGDPLQAGGVSQREGEQFVVPFEQMAHCPWSDGHTALAQVLIDFGHTAMLRVTQGTDRRNDIKAKLVLG